MRHWLRTCARLWERAKNERSTPREIGWSIAVGVFSGCTPFFGFHMWIALGLATLLRLHPFWAFVGSRVSFTPLFAVVAFSEIEGAHRLRTGTWTPLSPRDAVAHGWEMLSDWLLGACLLGTLLATLCGIAAYLSAFHWQAAAARRRSAPESAFSRSSTPPSARPPSSESPPSTPPAPTR